MHKNITKGKVLGDSFQNNNKKLTHQEKSLFMNPINPTIYSNNNIEIAKETTTRFTFYLLSSTGSSCKEGWLASGLAWEVARQQRSWLGLDNRDLGSGWLRLDNRDLGSGWLRLKNCSGSGWSSSDDTWGEE